MTGHQIALTALTIGACGLVSPRAAFAAAIFSGVIYLTLGWIPYGS